MDNLLGTRIVEAAVSYIASLFLISSQEVWNILSYQLSGVDDQKGKVCGSGQLMFLDLICIIYIRMSIILRQSGFALQPTCAGVFVS